MKMYPIEPGSVVRSTAGRDQGRLFIVVSLIDGDFAYVANGKLRTMEHLKKKRRKHLKPTGHVVGAFVEKQRQGEPVLDHEIRAWLKEEEEKLVQV